MRSPIKLKIGWSEEITHNTEEIDKAEALLACAAAKDLTAKELASRISILEKELEILLDRRGELVAAAFKWGRGLRPSEEE
tara:strand:- start:4637 stop:4879 length:243 start_codon:yes stop_codon:yes gene_type:complete